MSSPRLSIVVVTRNRADLLRRSLASIFREVQNDYGNAEVVVIDGGSTDGTVEVLKQYQSHIAYWSSEPDSGAAEAANKGIFRSSGEIIRLIGDDDEFLPGRLALMMQVVDNLPEYGVIAGHNDMYEEFGPGDERFVPQQRFRGELSRRQMYQWGNACGIIIPEVCFFRRSTLLVHHGYRETLKWWGFLDLFLRMINSGTRFFVLPIKILKTYQTLKSDTFANLSNPAFWEEFYAVVQEHAGLRWRLWHQYGGTLRPDRVATFYAKQVCKATGFHPRATLRSMLRGRAHP